MGHVFTPPLDRLVEFCAGDLGIDVFIETGTYRGQSAAWAASRFRRVITIEASSALHEQARASTPSPNIEFLCGRSDSLLREVLPGIIEPKVFWLDAHWCGNWDLNTAGQENQCPLLKELEILTQSRSDDVILIDDFHMFAVPPPAPFRIDQWPDLETIFHSLQQLRPDRKIFIYHNVLIVAFGRLIVPLQQFFRDAPT